MNILLLVISYPPALNSAARLFSELAESLAAAGHQVSVLTSVPERYLAENREGPRQYMPEDETINDVRVYRLRHPALPKGIPFLRAFEHLFFAIQYYVKGRKLARQDAVIVYSPPLPLGIAGIRLARRWRSTTIVNIQDLYPQSVVDLGLLKSRLLVSLARRMERFVYRRAEAITVHSEGNRSHVIQHGGKPENVHVVYNWINTRRYSPGVGEEDFRTVHGLDQGFIVSYAGVMGFAQGVVDIVKAASILQNADADIVFVLAGGGVELHKIKEFAREENVSNLRFLPHLPESEYISLLQSSDLCLVTLVRSLKTPVVPGKLPCIMAVGKPVVCSTPSTSDAKKIIEEAECGQWVEAGNPAELARVIHDLYLSPENGERLGRNGRSYAAEYFQLEGCTAKYAEIINALDRKTTSIDKGEV